MKTSQNTDWLELANKIGAACYERAAQHDQEETFVEKNYAELKANGFLSATIPVELGGGGASHSEMCDILRTLGQYCGSTALALSMHQHLLATNIWKYRQGQGGEPVLRKVAEKQLILVSTGAKDWLESNGEMTKTEGGYLVSGVKHFASQSAVGDVLVTSAPYEDPNDGWQVLHFPVPFTSEGLTVMNNWHTLGMRGTGSHTVKLEKVFVPESAIVLRRPRGKFHPFWNVVLVVAMPYIMSVYVGIAQKAATLAVEVARGKNQDRPYIPYLVGEMNNELTSAELHLKDMIRIANNLDFKPIDQNGQDILTRKTNIAKSCIQAVSKAMEITGGQGFFRNFGLERLFRDIQASQYHPLPERDQQLFSGEYILNNGRTGAVPKSPQ
jgi:alkylation response protein AidB-like acyl-CoA dehydrogenase